MTRKRTENIVFWRSSQPFKINLENTVLKKISVFVRPCLKNFCTLTNKVHWRKKKKRNQQTKIPNKTIQHLFWYLTIKKVDSASGYIWGLKGKTEISLDHHYSLLNTKDKHFNHAAMNSDIPPFFFPLPLLVALGILLFMLLLVCELIFWSLTLSLQKVKNLRTLRIWEL